MYDLPCSLLNALLHLFPTTMMITYSGSQNSAQWGLDSDLLDSFGRHLVALNPLPYLGQERFWHHLGASQGPETFNANSGRDNRANEDR
jgi:hypothetical protein